ncbi:MAG: ribonuclease HI family protein [Planctomycetes bacterium]|nr:ribonuclease HI family protein [Planctomycetota bacterium]
MSDSKDWLIHTDGGARGNPGPAAFAYVIERPGEPDIEENGFLGETTNNIAEYAGLVKALEHAKRLGGKKLVVQSDSELMVRQMNGEYKVKNAGLRPLFEEADALRRDFDKVTLRHVRRELNKRADALCNEALDGAAGKRAGKLPSAPRAETSSNREDLEARVRDDALACLSASAAAWANSQGGDPAVEDVWEQLWSILVEANVLRPKKK